MFAFKGSDTPNSERRRESARPPVAEAPTSVGQGPLRDGEAALCADRAPWLSLRDYRARLIWKPFCRRLSVSSNSSLMMEAMLLCCRTRVGRMFCYETRGNPRRLESGCLGSASRSVTRWSSWSARRSHGVWPVVIEAVSGPSICGTFHDALEECLWVPPPPKRRRLVALAAAIPYKIKGLIHEGVWMPPTWRARTGGVR